MDCTEDTGKNQEDSPALIVRASPSEGQIAVSTYFAPGIGKGSATSFGAPGSFRPDFAIAYARS